MHELAEQFHVGDFVDTPDGPGAIAMICDNTLSVALFTPKTPGLALEPYPSEDIRPSANPAKNARATA